MPLLEVPGMLAERGYGHMQLCHFHLPSRDAAYVGEFRAALGEAGVDLHALLIDEGDISHPEHSDRDAAWIASWLETASALGAHHARVIAGKQPATRENVERSIRQLKSLVRHAEVRVEIENWFSLTDSADVVNQLLDSFDGSLGLCADWGNWPRPRKYTDLPLITDRAETCHAKLEFVSPDALDEEDAAALFDLTRRAGFDGIFVLVNGGSGESEWDALDLQREALEEAFA